MVENPADLLPQARELARSPKPSRAGEPVAVSNSRDRAAVRGALDAARGAVPPTGAAAAVFECIEAGLSGGWRACLDAEREHLVRLRGEPEGRAAIEAFFAKSKAKA